MHLSLIDGSILGLYLVVVLAVGFLASGRTRSGTDFFLAGRSIPAWVCGLAFISANLGAQEVIGMGASGAKYGMATAHFYWLGAIPAMVFIGIFMMPFYYGSKARSAPEYLRLRFDEKTRGLNALSFAVMTIIGSGVSMYAMAKLITVLHVLDAPFAALHLPQTWIFHAAILASALVVMTYIYAGGLRGAIYNEVLQFFLIVAGFVPLAWLSFKAVGGWQGMTATLDPSYLHVWKGMGSPETNRMGIDAGSLIMGLGFVLSFGYWTTDFLVVQRAMAADSMGAARRTPLIAAFPKMLFPFLVIVPGLAAMALTTAAMTPAHPSGPGASPAAASQGIIPVKLDAVTGQPMLDSAGKPQLDYDLATPNLLIKSLPTGMLGLGLTALLASFMSGMAGNVTAFNTVWTYDIYQAYIRKEASDAHYLAMGRIATAAGILLSIGAAYMATQFNNIMDLIQLICAFVNAPVFATFLLGMFWKRATGHGAFWGLLAGTAAAALHHGLTLSVGAVAGIKGGWLGLVHTYPSEMAQNFTTAIWAWSVCFVLTIVGSLMTKAHDEESLVGLVYSLTPKVDEPASAWFKSPVVLGVIVLAATLALNIVFW